MAPIYEPPSSAVPGCVEDTIRAILVGDRVRARTTLRRIDFAGLTQERDDAFTALRSRGFKQHKELDPTREDRRGPTEAAKLDLFVRDSFTCWFCGKRTVYAPILAALSTVPQLEDLVPYRTGWKPTNDHILFWTCTPSWEHLIPVARGGASTESNIVTSCYQCQDVKGDYLHTEIGWEAVKPVESGWLGLNDLLNPLYSKLGLMRARTPIPRGTPVTGDPPVGALIRATIPNKGKPYRNTFRVERFDGDIVVLSGMWRVGPQRRWHVGNPYSPCKGDIRAIEVIRDPAPNEGDV